MLKEIKKWKKENNKKYKELQAVFSYNSNRIEGNSLELAQVKKLAEGKTLKSEVPETAIQLVKHLKLQDDIREVENHFRCLDYVIDTIDVPLSHEWLFELHRLFLEGVSKEKLEWYTVGGYKTIQNYVGGRITAKPEHVYLKMTALMDGINESNMDLESIIKFHCEYEHIHPFIDGNGRTGRLIMFRQCLKNNVKPFIVEYSSRMNYYKGLSDYPENFAKLVRYFENLQEKFLKTNKPKISDLDNKTWKIIYEGSKGNE